MNNVKTQYRLNEIYLKSFTTSVIITINIITIFYCCFIIILTLYTHNPQYARTIYIHTHSCTHTQVFTLNIGLITYAKKIGASKRNHRDYRRDKSPPIYLIVTIQKLDPLLLTAFFTLYIFVEFKRKGNIYSNLPTFGRRKIYRKCS